MAERRARKRRLAFAVSLAEDMTLPNRPRYTPAEPRRPRKDRVEYGRSAVEMENARYHLRSDSSSPTVSRAASPVSSDNQESPQLGQELLNPQGSFPTTEDDESEHPMPESYEIGEPSPSSDSDVQEEEAGESSVNDTGIRPPLHLEIQAPFRLQDAFSPREDDDLDHPMPENNEVGEPSPSRDNDVQEETGESSVVDTGIRPPLPLEIQAPSRLQDAFSPREDAEPEHPMPGNDEVGEPSPSRDNDVQEETGESSVVDTGNEPLPALRIQIPSSSRDEPSMTSDYRELEPERLELSEAVVTLSADQALERVQIQREVLNILTTIAPLDQPGGNIRVLMNSSPFSPVVQALDSHKDMVVAALRRLETDEQFATRPEVQELLSFRQLLATRSVSQADETDPFEAAIDQLPEASSETSEVADERINAQCLSGLLIGEADMVANNYAAVGQQLEEWSRRRAVRQTELMAAERKTTDACDSPGSSTLAAYGFDLSARSGTPKRRANLSKDAKDVLRIWFESHVHHPYPSEDEKASLAREGGITMEQVNNWFINTRGRKWKPMLNRLMAEKQAGECKLLDDMVQRIAEPYRRDL